MRDHVYALALAGTGESILFTMTLLSISKNLWFLAKDEDNVKRYKKNSNKRTAKPAKNITKRRLKIKLSFIDQDIIPDSFHLFLWPVQ